MEKKGLFELLPFESSANFLSTNLKEERHGQEDSVIYKPQKRLEKT